VKKLRGGVLATWGVVFCLAIGFASVVWAAGEEYYPAVDFDPELNALFQKGMTDREAGDLDAAIEAFQTILSNQPLLHRARLELAVAYYQDRHFQEAVQHAEQVLADPKTPPNVRVSILAFLAQVKKDADTARQVRHFWRFPLSLGFLYDGNANAGPDRETIGAAGLAEYTEERESTGTMYSVGIDHTMQSGRSFRLRQRDVSFLWQSGLNVYQRNYSGDEEEFDLHVYSVRTGPTLVSRASWRANLTVQEDFIRYGGENLAYYSYLLPSWTINFTDALEATLDGIVCNRDYIEDARQGQDSLYLAGRLSFGYTVGKDRFAIQGGAMYFTENADDDQFSKEGVSVFGGVNWRVYRKNNLFVTASWQREQYDAPPAGFTDAEARDEDEWRYAAGVNHTFQDFGVFSDWEVEAKLVYTDKQPNVAAFDYERTQFLLTFAKTFK